MIQLCPTCGQMRIHHPNRELYRCPVPKEVTEALQAFAREHGKRWKSALLKVWDEGTESELLRQARNMIGKRRLYTITI